jgi:hypothetical protein
MKNLIASYFRSSNFAHAIVVFVVSIVGLETVVAAEVPSAGERFRQILTRQEVHLDRNISANPAFCDALLLDLKAKRNIEFVEPLFRTDDPNDSRLKPYHGCKDYWPTIPGNPPENAYAFLDGLGTRGFALYRIDLDNNPANGIEELLYAETDPDNPTFTPSSQVFPGYNRIDLKRCLRIEGIPVNETYQGKGAEMLDVNALIRYSGHYYVLDLSSYRTRAEASTGADASLNINLWNFVSNIKNKRETYPCIWKTIKK